MAPLVPGLTMLPLGLLLVVLAGVLIAKVMRDFDREFFRPW